MFDAKWDVEWEGIDMVVTGTLQEGYNGDFYEPPSVPYIENMDILIGGHSILENVSEDTRERIERQLVEDLV